MTPTPKNSKAQRDILAAARSKVAAGAMWDATVHRSKGSQRTVDGRRLVITDEPELIINPEGRIVGVAFQVRLYDSESGAEIKIDPVRWIINPPTEIATPEGELNEVDPLGAIWSVLWDSVTDHPNPQHWRP